VCANTHEPDATAREREGRMGKGGRRRRRERAAPGIQSQGGQHAAPLFIKLAAGR
jgi:hypothetical protein